MRIKTILIMLAAMLGPCLAVNAQDDASASINAHDNANAPADANWYVSMDYDGLMFQVPSGMRVERGKKLTALYPDGTFGVTMETVNHASTQSISKKLCQRLADSLGLPQQLVKKQSFGKVKGAMAQGKVDDMLVACVVLPIDKHQVMITVMGDQSRVDWIKNFLNTLKR